MPPDLEGDVNNDGIVDIFDAAIVSAAMGSTWGDPNWDPRADLNADGVVDLFDAVIVSRNAGHEEDSPVAYSTTFDLTVPSDGDYEVWYYVLARVYVPQELSGQGFYLFPDEVNDWIRNVKLDSQLKYSGGHPECQPPANVSLGVLGGGYHLLELEFGEQWVGGRLQFHVATASGQSARLARFRIYVPNYSDNTYNYTVTVLSWFPGDRFYLKGFADDCIEDVWLDVGHLWRDWEWDNGEYGAFYGWGDGFLYPLGRLGPQSHVITFTFRNKQAGLLDFRYVSLSNEPDLIGNPIFRAENIIGGFWYQSFRAGSSWSDSPGISNRNIAMHHYIRPLETNLEGVFCLDAGVCMAPLVSSEFIDFGIMLKLHLISNPEMDGVVFRHIKIDIYTDGRSLTLIPGNILEYANPEDPNNNSPISEDNKILLDMIIEAAAALAAIKLGPIGAIAGAVIGGALEDIIFSYAEQEEVIPKHVEAGGNSTHATIDCDPYDIAVFSDIFGGPDTDSDLTFVRLMKNEGLRCGLVKVVISGELVPWTVLGEHPIPYQGTIFIPWFIKD